METFSAVDKKNGDAVGLEYDGENVLDRVEEQIVAEELQSDEAVEAKNEKRSVLHHDRSQQTPDLELTALQGRQAPKRGRPEGEARSAGFDGRQDDGELEETERPDGQDHVVHGLAPYDISLLKQIEQLHDVETDAEVDEEQKGKLFT